MAPRKPNLKAQLGKVLAAKKKQGKKSTPAAAAGAAKSTKAQQQQKPTATPTVRRDHIPYTLEDDILLVGEGNFSFALGLASLLGSGEKILATAYDSRDVVLAKYPDAAAITEDFESALEGKCLYDVDATHLAKCPALRGKRFSKIVFNFPHVGLGIKDQDRNVRANQQLLLGFFKSVMHVSTATTEIVVTVKTGTPYDLWNLKRLAKQSGLVTKTSFGTHSFVLPSDQNFNQVRIAFNPAPYHGYEHRRTLGHDDSVSASANAEIKNAKTFVFATASDDLLEKIAAARGDTELAESLARKRPLSDVSSSAGATSDSKRARNAGDKKNQARGGGESSDEGEDDE
ncbi:hypothetical protein BC828DRAFT_394862 [Blastocladiella britannica]|nr:hypothetical protein BC828DRAFT_394862 [Blastocladiella britannica]